MNKGIFLLVISILFLSACQLQQNNITENIQKTANENSGITVTEDKADEADAKTFNLNEKMLLIWKYPADLLNTPPSYPIRTAFSPQNQAIAVTYSNGIITCLSSQTGKINWNHHFPFTTDIVQMNFHPNGDLYVLDLSSSKIWILDSQGKEKNTVDFDFNPNYIKTVPAFVFAKSGNAYCGSPDGKIICISEEGKKLWRTNIGTNPENPVVTPVSAMALAYGEEIIVAVSSFDDINLPVYGLDASSGEILWSYQNKTFQNICYIETDSTGHIFLPLTDKEIVDKWLSSDPSVPSPPIDSIRTTIGGCVAVLDLNGKEVKQYPIMNTYLVRYVKSDPIHQRFYVIGDTYIPKQNGMLGTQALFAFDDSGTLLWDTVSKPSFVSVRNYTDSIVIDKDHIYIGSSESGIKKYDLKGDIVESLTLFNKKREGVVLIDAADQQNRELYIYGEGETISREYGRLPKIYKVTY